MGAAKNHTHSAAFVIHGLGLGHVYGLLWPKISKLGWLTMTTFISASKDKVPPYRYRRYSDLVLSLADKKARREQRRERVKSIGLLLFTAAWLGLTVFILRRQFL